MPQEEERKHSRVVVETPHARREVEQVYSERTPKREGYSTGAVAAVAFAAIMLTALLVFFLVNSNSENKNTNINATIATQPTPLPRETITPIQPTITPIVPTTQPAPVIIAPPATTTAAPPIVAPQIATPPVTAPTPAPTPREPDDTTIQNNISKKFLDDPDLATADVSTRVGGGKAILTGRVATPGLRNRAAKLALSVKGVRAVDNKIVVDDSNSLTPPLNPTPTP